MQTRSALDDGAPGAIRHQKEDEDDDGADDLNARELDHGSGVLHDYGYEGAEGPASVVGLHGDRGCKPTLFGREPGLGHDRIRADHHRGAGTEQDRRSERLVKRMVKH
eukprot:scaffold4943_cov127-Isochrysis_galbana.AAC.3